MKKLSFMEGDKLRTGSLKSYKDKKGATRCASVQKYLKPIKCHKPKIIYEQPLTRDEIIKESGFKGDISLKDLDYIKNNIYKPDRDIYYKFYSLNIDTENAYNDYVNMTDKKYYDYYITKKNKQIKMQKEYSDYIKKINKQNIMIAKKYFKEKK